MVEQSLSESMVAKQTRFDKYFDDNEKCAYFYDRQTGESIWELPEGVDQEKDVTDHTKEVLLPLEEATSVVKGQGEESKDGQVDDL